MKVTVCLKTGRVCHVWCNFQAGHNRQTTVILVTLKDGSLEINNSTSNIFFSVTETSSKMTS